VASWSRATKGLEEEVERADAASVHPEDVELLRVVSNRAAIAIDRALAYEKVVRLTELQGTLHTQAERMSRLVERLLDMSRLDAASIRVNPEPIALRQSSSRSSAPARSVTIGTS
jgi:signal transduction histidine kinase